MITLFALQLRKQVGLSSRHVNCWLVALCFGLLGSCGPDVHGQPLTAVLEGEEMATLFIDFQEGFSNDTVVIQVNEDAPVRLEQVSTKMVLGLAESITTRVSPGAVRIEIDVPTRAVKKIVELQLEADTYLGISISGNTLEVIVSEKPFTYG